MLDNLIDDVNELIKLSIGDQGRLEHIRKTLEDGKTLYSSDKVYLQQQIKNLYGNSSPENTEYLPSPSEFDTKSTSYEINKELSENQTGTLFCSKCGNRLLSNSNFCSKCGSSNVFNKENHIENKLEKSRKKGWSKKKKIGIVIGVLVLIFFTSLGFRNNDISSSDSNLEPIIFSGSYDDLLRNEDKHKNEIVKFSGYVLSTQKTFDGYDINVRNTYNLEFGSKYYLIHNYPDRLLPDDGVSGYGTYYGICAESIAGDPYACFKDVKLTNIDFNLLPNDPCDDLIAKQFALC